MPVFHREDRTSRRFEREALGRARRSPVTRDRTFCERSLVRGRSCFEGSTLPQRRSRHKRVGDFSDGQMALGVLAPLFQHVFL